jgi:hypothetical protein
MPKYIVCCHPIFGENAVCLSKKLDIPIITKLDAKEGDVYIIFGAHMYAEQLLELQRNVKVGFIILNGEPESNIYLRNKSYIQLMKNNPVYGYDKPSVDYLKSEFGVNCLSSFYYEFMGVEEADQERPIDILFVGTKSKDRDDLRISLERKYPDKKIMFVFDESLLAPEKMKSALLNARIVINAPFYKNKSLESHRIHNALSAGCMVVSHDECHEDLLKYYSDYISFTDSLSDFDYDSVEKKRPYSVLVKDLANRFLPHFLWITNKICGNDKDEGK